MKTSQQTSNRTERPQAFRRLTRFLLIYFFCLLAVDIIYHKTPITFFRTETGEWLRFAHGPVERQQKLLHEFWKTSSHGHYTPLAFSAEFLFTKWADTKALPWKVRQLGALALLAAILFVVIRSIARMLRISNRAAICIAIGLTAAFVCQPLVRDLIGWPFHIFQVVWMILMLATLAALLELLAHPDEHKWAWIAVATSYASMHALGLGFVTWIGTAVALSILLLSAYRGRLTTFRDGRKTLFSALIVLLVLGTAHAFFMYLLVGPPRPLLAQTAPFQLSHALGLIAIYPVAVAMNFFGILPTSFDGISLIAESAAPYGVLIMLAAAAGVWTLARSAFHQGNSAALSRSVICSFSFVASFAFIGLFAMREFYEIGALDFDLYKFFVDTRYVLPFSITLLGSALLLLLPLARRRQNFAAGFAIALGVTAFVAHVYVERTVRPHVLANNSISHDEAWKAIVATARECRAAGLPIPNLPMESLITLSPKTRLDHFEPVLHDALQLPAEERCSFVEWGQSRGPERSKYDSAVPSLRRVVKLLRINDSTPQP